jgi:hypothetical protein
MAIEEVEGDEAETDDEPLDTGAANAEDATNIDMASPNATPRPIRRAEMFWPIKVITLIIHSQNRQPRPRLRTH